VTYPLIIIGAGLSGLAAGIRVARFGQKVLILEKHTKAGGLNSYYYRNGMLFETGLHAITNYASPDKRQAPLNRLFRQLKISRKQFEFRQQFSSEIVFKDHPSLVFSNDFSQLSEEISRLFPASVDGFLKLVAEIDNFDPFVPHPWMSARQVLENRIADSLLVDMLLCPLFFYGSCNEDDMDYAQFVIMFRSIYQEGFCRPPGTIKDFLSFLLSYYKESGGEIRFGAGVEEILVQNDTVHGVRLENGEELQCDTLLSTIGLPETARIVPEGIRSQQSFFEQAEKNIGRLSFVESISLLCRPKTDNLKKDRTIIFYNLADRFAYRRPADDVDLLSGVICFPDNFEGVPEGELLQLRATHLANYDHWKAAYVDDRECYANKKKNWQQKSNATVGKIIGKYEENIVYDDFFTPITIERYTGKANGAVYGSSRKIKDGVTPVKNLFIGGTDQGFLGIIGSMLSGISMANQHFLISS
jgi:phytoene dehydrogenase-like protein